MLSPLLLTAEQTPYVCPKAWITAGSGYLSTTGSSVLGISGSAITLSMLVWLDSVAVDGFLLTNGGRDYFINFDHTTGKWIFQLNNGAAFLAGPSALMANAWYRITARLAGTGAGQHKTRQALIGGTSSEATQIGATISHTSNAVTVGADQTGASPMTGRFCDVAIWNAALSDAEVALLEAGRRAHTLDTKPVGYWPMTASITEPDYSGNGNKLSTTPTIAVAAGPYALDRIGGLPVWNTFSRPRFMPPTRRILFR